MITSDKSHPIEQQRGEYPLGMRPSPSKPVQPQKLKVTIVKTVETPFGATKASVKLTAVDPETGDIIDSMTYSCNAWEVERATNRVKQADFAEQLRAEGYDVC